MKQLIADLSSSNRGFGIEIEMALPSHAQRQHVQQTLAAILTRNDLPSVARGYSNTPLPQGIVLGIEFDASISEPAIFIQGQRLRGVSYAQIELKTTILRSVEVFERIVPKALGICKAIGAKGSGGLHVHLGLSEIRSDPSRIRSIYNLLHRFENILFALQPPSRSSTDYAKPLPDKSRLLHRCKTLAHYKLALEHIDKFHGVNFDHL